MENLNKKRPEITGILLASGSSRRFGSPKQLIDWDGKYLINHVIDQILKSEICTLFVVLGDHYEEILPVIDKEKVIPIRNDNWQIGKSSSIKAGISNLKNDAQGVMFFVVDQPYINSSIIDKLIHEFLNSSCQVIAPKINGRMSNPVLFGRDYFSDLSQLTGEQGGKTIIQKSKNVKWIEWEDEDLLLDIDTKQAYLELKGRGHSGESSF